MHFLSSNLSMYASKCIENPNMFLFECDSKKIDDNFCYCGLRGHEENFSMKNIRNDELYNDLHYKDVIDHDNEEKWSSNMKLRILDCLDGKNNTTWICKTLKNEIENTLCQCISIYSPTHIMGSLNTYQLYKGLNNSNTKNFNSDFLSKSENKIDNFTPLTEKDLHEIESIDSQKSLNLNLKSTNLHNTRYTLIAAFCLAILLLITLFCKRLQKTCFRKIKYTRLTNARIF